MKRSTTLLVIATIAFWYSVAIVVRTSYLVPFPHVVLHELLSNWQMYSAAALITAAESLGGLVVAIVMGVSLAILMFFRPRAEAYIMPYAVAIKATPVVAFAPLLAVYLGPGWSAKVTMSAMIAFFSILQYTWDGLKSVPEGPRNYAAVLGASRRNDLMLVRVWFVAPAFGSALKIAAPLAVVGAMVAEFVQSDKGIGHLLTSYLNRSDAPGQFAATITVAIVGFSFYGLALGIEKVMLRRARMTREDFTSIGR